MGTEALSAVYQDGQELLRPRTNFPVYTLEGQLWLSQKTGFLKPSPDVPRVKRCLTLLCDGTGYSAEIGSCRLLSPVPLTIPCAQTHHWMSCALRQIKAHFALDCVLKEN